MRNHLNFNGESGLERLKSQAIGRAFRPVQIRKVYTYRLIAASSPEEEDHTTCFRKESIAKMWFEWNEYYGHHEFEMESIDVKDCGDEFLETPWLNEDVTALSKRELAFVANKRNTIQHIVLFSWSDKENGVTIADIEADDSWLPTIYLQANTDDENMILGLAINKAHKDEQIRLVCRESDTEVSSCCILMCLTADGKLVKVHFSCL